MSLILISEQLLNGLQFGLMLFLIAAGLTLVFGIMDIMNLAHGSLYMAGAYVAAETMQRTGSFTAAIVVAVAVTALVGIEDLGWPVLIDCPLHRFDPEARIERVRRPARVALRHPDPPAGGGRAGGERQAAASEFRLRHPSGLAELSACVPGSIGDGSEDRRRQVHRNADLCRHGPRRNLPGPSEDRGYANSPLPQGPFPVKQRGVS